MPNTCDIDTVPVGIAARSRLRELWLAANRLRSPAVHVIKDAKNAPLAT